jgi:hypothetical protein
VLAAAILYRVWRGTVDAAPAALEFPLVLELLSRRSKDRFAFRPGEPPRRHPDLIANLPTPRSSRRAGTSGAFV